MYPYINIHTHHPSADKSICVVNNRFGFDKEIYTSSEYSIGVHPWDVTNNGFPELENFIIDKNCIAIGECGLDKLKGPDMQLQFNYFVYQLQLAIKYNKPVIIHCVKAFDELITACEPYQNRTKLIIHGFNKSTQLAEQLIDNGFYLSLNEAVLKKEEFNLSVLPLKKLFFETDTLETMSIDTIYQLAALKLNYNLDVLKEKIYDNFVEIQLPHINQ